MKKSILILFISFIIYFSLNAQNKDAIFKKVNIYVRQYRLPSIPPGNYFTSDYLRLNSEYSISIIKPIFYIKNSFTDTICDLFLHHDRDSLVENYNYDKEMFYPYIVIDFIKCDDIIESISIISKDKYFRNENRDKLYYLKKEKLDFLKTSFPYIFD